MGTRRIALGVLALLWLVAVWPAAGADREITYTVTQEGEVRDVVVTTPLTNVLLSEDGGTMKSLFITFAPYGATVAELVPGTKTNEETLERQYVASTRFPFSLSGEGLEDLAFELESGFPTTTESGDVMVSFVGEASDLTVTKRFIFHRDAVYSIGVELLVENRGEAPRSMSMLLGSATPANGELDLYYLFDGERGTDLLAANSYFDFGGLGVMDKAVVFFLSLGEETQAQPALQTAASGNREFGVSVEAPVGSSSFDLSLYGGRRRFLLMEDAGLAALDDPGMGARLMIPVIQFLEILYRTTGNYGWAIILFTLLTRIILFPLMRKQYHSMAKMQRIQPKMKRVQERFKDDKQLQQQKMMELYKKEGVNPMSGCLPLLVQLPILILIWRAILYSGEAIHMAPGFLWIPDLSMHDPYFILVIVTTGIMMLQQWLMTPTRAEATGSQKYFGYIFPLIMAVLLWRFPAGLWLYYLLTTAAQVAQQAIVNREMEAAGVGRMSVEEASGESEDAGEEAGDEDGKPEGGG